MRIPSLIALVALVVLAAPAAAQPITSPASCAVTISRAPDDVREVVEAWVKAEPRCASSLDIRIIPTEGGLYLLAQDEHGGVRERIVPDAQSAGVLIASWVADDTFPPDKTVVFVPELSPPSAARAPTAPLATTNGVDAMASPSRSPRLEKWLSAALMFHSGGGQGGGLRGEVDVLSWTKWSLGLAIAKTAWGTEVLDVRDWPYEAYHLDDLKGVAYVARTMTHGPVSLRAALGAGVVRTRAQAYVKRGTSFDQEMWTLDESGTFATAEGSLLATLQLGKWGLQAGPVISANAQAFTLKQQNVWEPMDYAYQRAPFDVHILTGLRRTL
jgi:hypothetical protein